MNTLSQQYNVMYSVQRQISDGNLEVVSVRVPYQDKSTLHVLVDDIQISSQPVQDSPYTWVWDADMIRISPKVASGSQVLVRRVSPADTIKNIFNGQAEFTNESMDQNFNQLLWLAQEYGEGSGLHDVFSNINMHNYKITNVGKATDDDDVVTFGQYREDALGAWQAAEQAKESLAGAQSVLDRANTVADELEQTNAQITQKWATTEQQIDNAITEMNSAVQAGTQTIQDLKNSTIQQINDTKSQIGSNVQDSKNYAEQSKSYSQVSKSQADRAQSIADNIQDVAGGILQATEQIVIVADNIQAVKTDAMNITSINLVASDFSGNTNPITMPQWGQVGVDTALPEAPSGGSIYNVAMNLDAINSNHDNMDYIIKVANGMDNIPETVADIREYAQRAQSASASAQTYKTQAQQASTQAKNVVPQVTSQGTKQIDLVTAQGGVQVQAVTSAKDSALQALQNALGSHESALQQVGGQEVSKVQQQGITSVSSVSQEGTKQIQAVQAQASTQTQAIAQAGTQQVQAVKDQGAQQLSVLNNAITDIDTKIQTAQQYANTATQQAQSAKTSASTATQKASQASSSASNAKTYQTNAAASAATATAQATVATDKAQQAASSVATISTYADKASEEADRAYTQAQRAKDFAQQATTGQVQADWNQADSISKAYIKNKPNLASVATSGNYSDLIGVPEIPDPTWENIQNKPSTFSPSAHTHTRSQITDFTHTHSISEIQNLQVTLNDKQPVGDYATRSQISQSLQDYRLKSVLINWNELADLGEVGV